MRITMGDTTVGIIRGQRETWMNPLIAPTMNPKTPTNPTLMKKSNVLSYELTDLLEANTPIDVHRASYGLWLKTIMASPYWGEGVRTKTLMLSPNPRPNIEELLWLHKPLPQGFQQWNVYARQIVDQKVVKRASTHFMTNLDLGSAAYLSMTHSPCHVIWCEGRDNWRGKVIPTMGASYEVDLLDPDAVSEVMRNFNFEVDLPWDGLLHDAVRDHGFNKLTEFRRLFERSRGFKEAFDGAE